MQHWLGGWGFPSYEKHLIQEYRDLYNYENSFAELRDATAQSIYRQETAETPVLRLQIVSASSSLKIGFGADSYCNRTVYMRK